MPQPLISDFLGDIIYLSWLFILTIGMLFLGFKIYPAIIKINLLTLPPQIPPKQNNCTN